MICEPDILTTLPRGPWDHQHTKSRTPGADTLTSTSFGRAHKGGGNSGDSDDDDDQ